MPLYVILIDLTKAFDLVRREGFFKILPKTGCPPKQQSLIESLHTNMKETVLYDGSISQPIGIGCGVKQGCALAPSLLGIIFAVLLKHAFGTAAEGIYLHTRPDGRPFKLARLKDKTEVPEVLIRDMLFADAAVTPHTGTPDPMAVYNACIVSTLFYASETWSACAKQEKRLNAFHLKCIRHILGMSWKDKVPNT
ncbi:uncharacterized protein LOC143295948 [Babylonia areolata]|uniref:uncharacterized protein LOC143295948 n=1 Tax=Babylonia areolata TaxID=304850 RepID=UPI003FD0A296